MVKVDNQKSILQRVNEFLKDQGVELTAQKSQKEVIEQYILKTLRNNKEIQKDLYTPITFASDNKLRKLKNFVINKIANITRNTVEKSLTKQQKYNDNVLLVLEYLITENQQLRSQLDKTHADKS